MTLKNKLIIFFLILFVFSSGAVFCFAATAPLKQLEVTYPTIMGFGVNPNIKFEEYIRYIFYFVIAISGIITLVACTIAGFQFITSAGDSAKLNDAKDRIKSALTGVFLIFCSFILLNTINPKLTVPELQKTQIFGAQLIQGGVFLCNDNTDVGKAWDLGKKIENPATSQTDLPNLKDAQGELLKKMNQHCYYIKSKREEFNSSGYNNWHVWLIPSKSDALNGYCLNSNECYQGYGIDVWNKDAGDYLIFMTPYDFKNGLGKWIPAPTYIYPFRLVHHPSTNWGATLYEDKVKNEKSELDNPESWPLHFSADWYFNGPITTGNKVAQSVSIEGAGSVIAFLRCTEKSPSNYVPIVEEELDFGTIQEFSMPKKSWWGGTYWVPCVNEISILAAQFM